MPESKGRIVYVMSDTRSGSTLLDQLLGAHDRTMSLGEVQHLVAYVRQDRAIYDPDHPLECSCGTRVEKCIFWQSVERRLGRPLGALKLVPRIIGGPESRRRRNRLARSLVWRVLKKYPASFSNLLVSKIVNSRGVAMDSFDLFDAILQVRDLDYLIDSSKGPLRFRSLFDYRPERMMALVLARDYRGTIHSKMKRGRDLKQSANTWAARLTQIKQHTQDVPKQQLLRVRYEDICNDPRAELGRICEFLNIGFSEKMLTRPTQDIHHLGGSPSKFDPAKKSIQLDQAYMNAFSDEQLKLVQDIVGDVATEWGYK